MQMADEGTRTYKCRDTGAGMGLIWVIGWIFTIGYVGLGFWQAVLAIVIWPYFLGVSLR